MPQVQAPELASAIRKRYGIRGVQGFDTMAPEMVPVTIVDDMTSQSALNCVGSRRQAAVAAQFSMIHLTAPTGVRALITRVWLTVSTSGFVWVCHPVDLVASTNAGEELFSDRTLRGTPGTQIAGTNNAALPTMGVQKQLRCLADTTLEVPLNVVLEQRVDQQFAGSHQLLVAIPTVNITLEASFEWQERAILTP